MFFNSFMPTYLFSVSEIFDQITLYDQYVHLQKWWNLWKILNMIYLNDYKKFNFMYVTIAILKKILNNHMVKHDQH